MSHQKALLPLTSTDADPARHDGLHARCFHFLLKPLQHRDQSVNKAATEAKRYLLVSVQLIRLHKEPILRPTKCSGPECAAAYTQIP